MKVDKGKEVKKYLKRVDKPTREKLEKAIDGLEDWQGDIKKIGGSDMYRLKIEHYRIGFSLNSDKSAALVEVVRPRGEFYKHIGR